MEKKMSDFRKERNELKVGIFTIFSLALGASVLIILSGLLSELTFPRKQYRAVFSLAHGVQSLVPSSKVRVGGMVMGVVNSVTPLFDQENGRILVDFEVDRDVPIYKNALVSVTSPLFPGPSFLDITDLGSGDEFASQKTELLGRPEGTLAKFLGPRATEDINSILGSLELVTGRFEGPHGILGGLLGHTQAVQVSEAIKQINANLKSLENLEVLLKKRLDGVMSSTENLLNRSQPLVEVLKNTLSRIENILGYADIILEEGGPSIVSSINDVKKIFEQFQKEIFPAVDRSVKKVEFFVKRMDTSFNSIQENAPKWSNDFSNILSNLDQLMNRSKAMINDLSASPWRLLYRPTNKELEYDRINQATWNLWHSVQELESLTQALNQAGKDKNELAQQRILEELKTQAFYVKESQSFLENIIKNKFPDMSIQQIND